MKKDTQVFKKDCRFFSGFKPCKNQSKCENCQDFVPRKKKCLIINYDALGDVLRTSLVAQILYHEYDVYWLTQVRARELIQNNPYIHKIYDDSTFVEYFTQNYDLVINFDKSEKAANLLNKISAKVKKGFYINSDQSIDYLGSDFKELYEMGLFDEIKFFKNQKTTNQLLVESLGIKWNSTYRYDLYFSEKEFLEIKNRRKIFGQTKQIVGLNVGCSLKYPYKKMDMNVLQKLLPLLERDFHIVLLGGLEDKEILKKLESPLRSIPDPCLGIRDGALNIAACDLLITGDTLALHLAIASQTKVLVWFGPSCAQEIELYNNGKKMISNFECSPCWKQSCDKVIKCNQVINPQALMKEVYSILGYSRLPSLEI